MGFFNKILKKRPEPNPTREKEPAATLPPAPEVKKRTSWINELADPALLRSFAGREAADYMHPYKGTAIYKAAVAHLVGGGGA